MMRIAVVGTGAIGTYYGGKLAAGGSDVHFLVRSGFEQVRKNGLHIFGPGEDIRISPVNAYRFTDEIGPCDLVLITIKATANADLLSLIPPLLGDQTLLLTLQNGLGNEEYLAQHFGAERVLSGLCFICLRRHEPGVVERTDHGQIRLGEYQRPPRQRTHALAEQFRRSGITCRVIENMAMERWRKLVWNIPFNGLTIAHGGIDTAAILCDPKLRQFAECLMAEVISAANRCGLPLEAAAGEEQMRATETMGAYKPSTLVDFEEGRPLEIEAIWGEPLRRATAAGASMPHLQELYEALKSLSPIAKEARSGPKIAKA